MIRRFYLRKSLSVISRCAAVGALAVWLLSGGLSGWGGVILMTRDGDARLISYQPLPEMQEGEDCLFIPAGTLMAAALQQDQRLLPRFGGAPSAREPLRVIRDPYPSPSSVAVDMNRGEVVTTDENKFQVLVYNRLDNTPPTAPMTEPKRVIAGKNTNIEFQCGLYVDQASGDIYAVNNDTQDKLVIFSRQAQGDVPPDRWLETPHGTFGIVVDEKRQELFLTAQHDSAVVVYRKMAVEEEAPIRLLQGDRTLLADPHGIALDTKNDLMFVANYGSTHSVPPSVAQDGGRLKANWPVERNQAIPGSGRFLPPSITVYPSTASGDTGPLRVIVGPKTQLNWPTGLAFDSERGELFVSNDMGHSIVVFRGDANGDVAPVRVLKGPKSGIRNPTGLFLDTKNDELWVSNFGNHSLTVYPVTADGDTAPLRTIRTAPVGRPSLMIGNPGAVGYDTKRREILVPN